MGISRAEASALLAYSRLRSAVYSAEGLAIPMVELLVTGRLRHVPTADVELLRRSKQMVDRLLREDVGRIEAGVYPPEVLMPESPVQHIRRVPRLLMDGVQLNKRRMRRQTKAFGPEAAALLNEVPEYYRRNFHFQKDGYLSEASARLYDHQVEALFGGSADAMRRLVIAPMKRRLGSSDGEGLRILEVGAGTGRATRMIRLAFPKARIVALDLSAPYLKVAREELSSFARIDFIEGAGESLPFQDGLFDACFSVFLHHELPRAAREATIDESLRVLRPGGFFGLVDSIQTGDVPEFDEALPNFPVNFHEPFYKDYISRPMEDVARERGVAAVESEIGGHSKCVHGLKPEAPARKARARKNARP